jgi:hypothetical protein
MRSGRSRTCFAAGVLAFALGASAAQAGVGEWTFIGGATERNARGFAVAGKPTVLYLLSTAYTATGHSQIYRSDDLGNSWQAYPLPETGLDGSGASLETGPGPTPVLYYVNVNAFDNKPFVFRSDDGGETWASTQETPPATPATGGPIVSPDNPNLQWKLEEASAGRTYPYLSQDGGKTWLLIRKGAPAAIAGAKAMRLAFDPNDSKRVFMYR